MHVEAYIKVAIGIGLAGALLSVFGFIASGSGNLPVAYQSYMITCAILLRFGVRALAIYRQK